MLSAYCHSILWLEIHSVGVIFATKFEKEHPEESSQCLCEESAMFVCACMEQLYSLFNLFLQNNEKRCIFSINN